MFGVTPASARNWDGLTPPDVPVMQSQCNEFVVRCIFISASKGKVKGEHSVRATLPISILVRVTSTLVLHAHSAPGLERDV